MAYNTDMPWGLRPLYEADARKTAMLFPITNNYGTVLYVNDPALAVAAGTIERGSTTGQILGPILGLYKQDVPLSLRVERLVPQLYMAATPGAANTWFALVAVDPSLFFVMQEDSDTSSLAWADNFDMVDLIYTHGGSTITGISKAEIDSNTVDSTATRPLQLVRPWVEYYDIDAKAYNAVTAATTTAGQFGKWIVRIACHQFRNTTASIPL